MRKNSLRFRLDQQRSELVEPVAFDMVATYLDWAYKAAMQIIQKARFLEQALSSNLTPHFQQVFQYARSH